MVLESTASERFGSVKAQIAVARKRVADFIGSQGQRARFYRSARNINNPAAPAEPVPNTEVFISSRDIMHDFVPLDHSYYCLKHELDSWLFDNLFTDGQIPVSRRAGLLDRFKPEKVASIMQWFVNREKFGMLAEICSSPLMSCRKLQSAIEWGFSNRLGHESPSVVLPIRKTLAILQHEKFDPAKASFIAYSIPEGNLRTMMTGQISKTETELPLFTLRSRSDQTPENYLFTIKDDALLLRLAAAANADTVSAWAGFFMMSAPADPETCADVLNKMPDINLKRDTLMAIAMRPYDLGSVLDVLDKEEGVSLLVGLPGWLLDRVEETFDFSKNDSDGK